VPTRSEIWDTLSYEEVMRLFQMNCIHHGLVDYMNVAVAILKGDPIAEVLKGDVIHEDQICYLLAPFVACVSLWDPEEYVLDPDGPCF
jgi:hypothetical protein